MIEIENLTKTFGTQTVISDVSGIFYPGKIYGFVGRNGSGKTVLMKMILGFIKPTSGTIKVNGKQVGKEIDIPDDIGAIIETPGFLPEYSAFQNLKLMAMIRGKITSKRIRETIKLVGLDPGRHEWPDFEGRYPHSLKKSRIGSGHEETSRKIFPWNASTPWHCTGYHGRSSDIAFG